MEGEGQIGRGRKTCLGVAQAIFFRVEVHSRQQFLGGFLGIILQVFGYLGIEDVVSTTPRRTDGGRGEVGGGMRERKKREGRRGSAVSDALPEKMMFS